MRFVLERVTDPDIEPVSVEEFIANVGEFEDAATLRSDEISLKIAAAREWAEDYTSRALIDQQWRLTIGDDAYRSDTVSGTGCVSWTTQYVPTEIMLRRSPVLSIESFKAVAADGTEADVDADTYELRDADSKWPRIVGLDATFSGVYRIVFRAGYANRVISPQEDASVVPARFRQGILLYAEALYDRDERAMERLMVVAQSLIRPERCDFDFA